jgi:Fur family ferric uptake transcriptional regulator
VGTPQPPETDAIRALVRGAGLRCTAARLAVMQHMVAAAGPQTHAEVSQALDHRGFDRATIYRNLTELTEARLVTRVDLGDHVWRFELRRHDDGGAGHGGDHPHFVCTTCGEVSCLDGVDVAITQRPGPRKARAGKRSVPAVTEVLLKGTCENCE